MSRQASKSMFTDVATWGGEFNCMCGVGGALVEAVGNPSHVGGSSLQMPMLQAARRPGAASEKMGVLDNGRHRRRYDVVHL